MTAAVHLRLEPHARLAPHVQRADALRAVGLVRGQAHQVHRQLRQVDLHLARRLRGIDVEDDAALATQRADRRDVLDHADLVVDEHHRDDDRVRPQRRLQHLEVEEAVLLHVEIRHVEALALEFAHRVEHRLVLGLHRDEVLAARLVEVRRALQRQVVRLGRTRRPDDLARVGVDQRRDLLARLLDRCFRFPPPSVAARRRVAEVLAQPGNHRVDDARIDRRRRAVVHVDRDSGSHVSYFSWRGLTSTSPKALQREHRVRRRHLDRLDHRLRWRSRA